MSCAISSILRPRVFLAPLYVSDKYYTDFEPESQANSQRGEDSVLFEPLGGEDDVVFEVCCADIPTIAWGDCGRLDYVCFQLCCRLPTCQALLNIPGRDGHGLAVDC
jgi:hypothetical protein